MQNRFDEVIVEEIVPAIKQDCGDPDDFVDRLRQRVTREYRRLPYPITAALFVVTRDGVAGTKAA